MKKSTCISIEVTDGKVACFEGCMEDTSFWSELIDPPLDCKNRRINEVLNLCKAQGYEVVSTETVGEKVIYRLRLVGAQEYV